MKVKMLDLGYGYYSNDYEEMFKIQQASLGVPVKMLKEDKQN